MITDEEFERFKAGESAYHFCEPTIEIVYLGETGNEINYKYPQSGISNRISKDNDHGLSLSEIAQRLEDIGE